MLKPLRLGISGSSFIYVMPAELRIAAYVTPVKKTPVKFDHRLNAMMMEFTREMMDAVNAVAIGADHSTSSGCSSTEVDPDRAGCALECYYSSAWDTDSVLDVVLNDPKVEFWSVHGPYGRNFDVSAPSESVRDNAVDAYCDAIRIAARLGAKIIVTHPGANEPYDVPRADRLIMSIDPLRRIAEFAGENDMSIAIEPLPKSEVGSRLEEVIDIVGRLDLPNVGINFDVNHQFPPTAIPGLIRQAGSRILSMHISDQDGIERHWLPFAGTLDWREILTALVEIGYTGPLIYESHIHDVKTCQEAAKIIAQNYTELIRLAPTFD